jgi:hypothetical protein
MEFRSLYKMVEFTPACTAKCNSRRRNRNVVDIVLTKPALTYHAKCQRPAEGEGVKVILRSRH